MKDLDQFVNHFRKLQPRFSRLYARMLIYAGITQPQYALLLELMQQMSKPISMTAISQRLYISKPAVTNLVDRLEKNKFLKRLSDPGDRRISLLEIQPKGKKIVREIQGRILKLIRDTAKQFNRNERMTIQKFYSVLATSIDKNLLHSRSHKR